ncbi:MAG: pilus assembly protein [Sphingomonadales bacterium]|nr:pilus assembly protein [Sphingomonadales bacterium]
MRRVANLMLKRLTQSTRGAVIVEFAICLPVLLLLYTGGCFVSDMIACNRKVTIATRSLVDLVTRTTSPAIVYSNPQNTNATSYLSASAIVLSPYRLDNATEQVSLLRICDATHAYVVWTQAQTQSADGSTVTSTTSTHTAGTVPVVQAQSAANVISIPATMITSPMVPTSPDGSNVCANLAPGTSTKTQVGTDGGWLYTGTINYKYTPLFSYLPISTTVLTHTIYMVPRLY